MDYKFCIIYLLSDQHHEGCMKQFRMNLDSKKLDPQRKCHFFLNVDTECLENSLQGLLAGQSHPTSPGSLEHYHHSIYTPKGKYSRFFIRNMFIKKINVEPLKFKILLLHILYLILLF